MFIFTANFCIIEIKSLMYYRVIKNVCMSQRVRLILLRTAPDPLLS